MTGWTKVALSDVITDARSGFASGAEAPDGVLQVRMNNVTVDGALDFSKERRVPPDAHTSRFALRPGDVLFNATNSPELVGKTALFVGSAELVVFSNHFLRLRTDQHRLMPSYLARWMQYQYGRGVFGAMAQRWVNQAAVRPERLLSIELTLPPLDEQVRIARVLDAADFLRSRRRRATAAASLLVQSIFAATFGRPDSPAVVPLADLVASDRPITYGILKPGPDMPSGVPYVRVMDIEGGAIRTDAIRRTTIRIATEYRRSTLAPGDLVMSIRGHVGRLAVVPSELAGANITQDSARLAVCEYDPRYVMEAIRSPPVQSWMRRRVKGAAVQGINLGDVKLIPIPHAPTDVQRGFSERARACDQIVDDGNAQLRQLDALFASLADRAFAGEL